MGCAYPEMDKSRPIGLRIMIDQTSKRPSSVGTSSTQNLPITTSKLDPKTVRKMMSLIAASAPLIIAMTTPPAEAKGCARGAAAGAVAGHYLHHHAIMGAVAGCLTAHAYYAHKARTTGPARH